MAPKAPGVPVAIVEPGRTLVYGGRMDENTANVWTFCLDEKGGGCRLISRWSFEHKAGLLNNIIYDWLLEPIAAVMQRKMMIGIKKRAEASPH